MSFTFAVAIFFIIWWLSLFAVLPFGLRTQDEAGEVVPGTPESAPVRPRLLRIFAINTLVASIVFALFWLGVTQGWLDPETFPFQVPVRNLPPP
jgi:predicted secreted protein